MILIREAQTGNYSNFAHVLKTFQADFWERDIKSNDIFECEDLFRNWMSFCQSCAIKLGLTEEFTWTYKKPRESTSYGFTVYIQGRELSYFYPGVFSKGKVVVPPYARVYKLAVDNAKIVDQVAARSFPSNRFKKVNQDYSLK